MLAGVVAVAACTLVLITSPSGSDAAAAVTNTWSGTWHTSWSGGTSSTADMVLTQTGDSVSGTYDHLTGTINGTVSGDTLSGSWTQSNDQGDITFTLDPTGASWSGTWTSGGGGGSWTGACTAGDCLANAAVTAGSSTTAAPAVGQRPSATVVQCDRDVNTTTNAKFQCAARVADAGIAPTPGPPTGTITWAASVGSFSATSCALVTPDLGTPSCTVEYDASNDDIPTQIAVPKLTASYAGDTVYAASQGAPALGAPTGKAGGNSSGGGVSPFVVAGGAAAVLAAIAAAIAAIAHLSGGGADAAGTALVEPGDAGGSTIASSQASIAAQKQQIIRDLQAAINADPAGVQHALQQQQAAIAAQQHAIQQDLNNAINADPSGAQHALQQQQAAIAAQQQKILQDLSNAINADPSGVQQVLQQQQTAISAQQQKILQDLRDAINNTQTSAPSAPPGTGSVLPTD